MKQKMRTAAWRFFVHFYHPDYTVGTGISPVQLALAGLSALVAASPPVGNYAPPRSSSVGNYRICQCPCQYGGLFSSALY